MKYDVITIGDVMKDIFLFPALDEIQKPVDGNLVFPLGGKVTISDTYEDIGGSAGNVAVGLSRLKIKSSVISAVGKDDIANEITNKLHKEKVDTLMLKIYSSRKSSFSIVISYKGERTILVRHSFEPDNFIIPRDLDTEWLYVGPLGFDYKSCYAKITGLRTQKNIKIAINPGSVQIHDGIRAFGALLSVADIIILNREEAKTLIGMNGIINIKDLAFEIRKTGVKIVIITDGGNGAYASFENDFIKVGSYPSTRVEATGAGDAFSSGFMAAYLRNEKMLTCLKWGVVNGAGVVVKYGAQQGLLSLKSIETKASEYHWPASDLRFS